MIQIIHGILNFDQQLLEFINIKLSNSFLDFLMPILDKPVGFILPVLFFWIYSIFKNPSKRLKLLLLIPLVITFTDQLGYRIKKIEIRDRPWVHNEQINHLGGKGGKHFSFPSNHAANSMAIATILVNILGSQFWYLYLFAVITGLSRVYIGVHFPGDIFVGFILGWVVARILILATNKLQSNLVKYHPAS
jgi:undecaprenyl-diphosphatase